VDTRDVLRSLSAVAVAAVLTGCAHQDSFSLPPLDPTGAASAPTPRLHYGYGPYPHYGYGYGYGTGHYPYGYHRYGYYPYTAYPYYYSPGYVAQPYAPPVDLAYPRGPYCRDVNGDGRCDVRRDVPGSNQPPSTDFFERLRDRIAARPGAGPTTPAGGTTADPRRPPPPPKVAPPQAMPAPAARTVSEPAR
jgi:hypothetical protein